MSDLSALRYSSDWYGQAPLFLKVGARHLKRIDWRPRREIAYRWWETVDLTAEARGFLTGTMAACALYFGDCSLCPYFPRLMLQIQSIITMHQYLAC